MCTGNGRRLDRWSGRVPRFHLNLHALVTKQLDACPPMISPAGVAPEERLTSHRERVQENAHLARFVRGVPIPLTLLSFRTRTATADAGSVHHAQAAIDFSTLLLHTKLLPGWTMECPIWLDREISA